MTKFLFVILWLICCLVLHPKYKLKYFADAGWDQTWIDTARQILRDEWDARYKPMIDPVFLNEVSPCARDDDVSYCLSVNLVS